MPADTARPSADGRRYELFSPTRMPRAGGFLWNDRLLLELNCRGYASAQHLQPEPSRYSHGPTLEHKTFMQPEPAYYAHHPGRFVYVKDEADGRFFSAPYEPVRAPCDAFEFSLGTSDARWRVENLSLAVELRVTLPANDAVEVWELSVRNLKREPRTLSVYPAFTVGYLSWLNQSATHDAALGSLVARSVTPYQKLADYARVRMLKDCTFLAYDTPPFAWESSRSAFEGEGGLHAPDAVSAARLGNGDADYEAPIAALQYRLALPPGGAQTWRFAFGPARDEAQIEALRQRHLIDRGFAQTARANAQATDAGPGAVTLDSPDGRLDAFVNTWLPRQVAYHGRCHRLTTDPQTRNYLQDAMGMAYLQPRAARRAILHALSQQRADGGLPDGILLDDAARLKYINEVPHTDHCVWLPLAVNAYLAETDDYRLLDTPVASESDGQTLPVFDRLLAAVRWLDGNRDARGLSLIAEGDWCDPMNMVGHRGKGVSGWLSIATVHVMQLVATLCDRVEQPRHAEALRAMARTGRQAIAEHLWDGEWYARGITDAGRTFGVSDDAEGRIFLNPQTWALMAGLPDAAQREKLLSAIAAQLVTPFGAMLLAPPFTRMHEDIGRVTQKFPGTAENGSVYNHAAMFFVHALYDSRLADEAFDQLMRALPGDEDDLLRRGQLPVFVPNYYRGSGGPASASAGRSSQLLHTGAASWMYRIVIEQLFGLKGVRGGLRVDPQLPTHWAEATLVRSFRDAHLDVRYRREPGVSLPAVTVNDRPVDGAIVTGLAAGRRYRIDVTLPQPV
ncbi:MAG: NdvB protein [Pseudomonadota bacterium]